MITSKSQARTHGFMWFVGLFCIVTSQANRRQNTYKKGQKKSVPKNVYLYVMIVIASTKTVKKEKKSKRWYRLEKVKYASTNTEVLKNRLLVTDEELRCVLGCGRTTARVIAQKADAVVRVNGRKLNSMEKVKQYIDSIAGK